MSKPAARPAPAKAAARPAAPAKRPAPVVPAGTSIRHSMFLLFVFAALSLGITVFVFSHHRSDRLIAVTRDDKAIFLAANDMPNTGSDAVINWAKLAVSEIFTYNFNNIIERMNFSRRFFTDTGWESFRSEFQSKEILALTTGQRRVETTLPTSTAVITAEGDVDGVHTWTVQIMAVTNVYTGQNNITSNLITLRIASIPTNKSISGFPFGIYSIQK